MYVINSEVKGLSVKAYKSYDLALDAARAAWKADPAGVGMCRIQSVDHDTIVAEADADVCVCCGPNCWLTDCACHLEKKGE